MADVSDKSSLLGNKREGGGGDSSPSYTDMIQEERQSPVAKLMQLAFVTVVVVMVVISLILSIVRGAKYEGLYVMLGLSLLFLSVAVIILAIFIKNGDLPREKSWFLYLIGGCILLEAIFTDVLLYE